MSAPPACPRVYPSCALKLQQLRAGGQICLDGLSTSAARMACRRRSFLWHAHPKNDQTIADVQLLLPEADILGDRHVALISSRSFCQAIATMRLPNCGGLEKSGLCGKPSSPSSSASASPGPGRPDVRPAARTRNSCAVPAAIGDCPSMKDRHLRRLGRKPVLRGQATSSRRQVARPSAARRGPDGVRSWTSSTGRVTGQ